MIFLWMMYAFDDFDHTGSAYPEKALKKDLWNIIKAERRPPEYAIDKIAEERGGLFY